jgi:hypothetical protein
MFRRTHYHPTDTGIGWRWKMGGSISCTTYSSCLLLHDCVHVFDQPPNGMWDFFHSLHSGLSNFLSRSHWYIFPPFCRVVSIFEFFSVSFSVSLSSGLTVVSHCHMKMLADHFSECVEKHAFHSYDDFIKQHGGKLSIRLSRDTLETSFLRSMFRNSIVCQAQE